MKLSRLAPLPLILAGVVSAAPQGMAFWVDGDGHYALRGSTETAPAFSKDRGTYQAIEQSFRLLGEARLNDQSSMFLELRLFDNMRENDLGDVNEPRDCAKSTNGKQQTDTDPCAGQHQNSGEPGYKPYTPKITKAYIRYAFDYCIIEAGRRGRDWGMGIFMDSGAKPFDTDASIYDGVSCDINLQKTQTLGFSVGYDKLAETGAPVDPIPTNSPGTANRRFGPSDPGDDLDQYYFTIQYDDRKANAGAAFTKQVGVYFAQVSGKAYKVSDNDNTREVGGDSTDLKFLDLYTGFYLGDLSLRNEILFRMGKSADPNWEALGGKRYETNGQPAVNKLDSIGFAGALEWTVGHSGAPIGPAEFNKGDATRHVLFFNYAYAPGDNEGYKNDQGGDFLDLDTDTADQRTKKQGDFAKNVPDQAKRTDMVNRANALNRNQRDNRVKGIAFHRNFKPALLLFNAHPDADDLIVAGSFNPSRMVNATLFATGYRYESMANGSFEAKFVTANMNESPGQQVKDYYNSISGTAYDDGSRPAGFYGKSLGYELDLTYSYKVGREAEVGVAGAGALPGKAWQTRVDSKPSPDFLVETFGVFRF